MKSRGRLAPKGSRGYIFFVFARLSFASAHDPARDGLSERGTTRSLMYTVMNYYKVVNLATAMKEACLWK